MYDRFEVLDPFYVLIAQAQRPIILLCDFGFNGPKGM